MRFRFVALTPVDAPQPSAYEIVHQDREPEGAGGVVLIDAPDPPPDDVPADQRGYLGSRLYRSLDSKAASRYVGIERWSSPLMVFRAARRGDLYVAQPPSGRVSTST